VSLIFDGITKEIKTGTLVSPSPGIRNDSDLRVGRAAATADDVVLVVASAAVVRVSVVCAEIVGKAAIDGAIVGVAVIIDGTTMSVTCITGSSNRKYALFLMIAMT
jgi:hypothetical protein